MVNAVLIAYHEIQIPAGDDGRDFCQGSVAHLRSGSVKGEINAVVKCHQVFFAVIHVALETICKLLIVGKSAGVIDNNGVKLSGKCFLVNNNAAGVQQKKDNSSYQHVDLVIFPDIPDLIPEAHLFQFFPLFLCLGFQ